MGGEIDETSPGQLQSATNWAAGSTDRHRCTNGTASTDSSTQTTTAATVDAVTQTAHSDELTQRAHATSSQPQPSLSPMSTSLTATTTISLPASKHRAKAPNRHSLPGRPAAPSQIPRAQPSFRTLCLAVLPPRHCQQRRQTLLQPPPKQRPGTRLAPRRPPSVNRAVSNTQGGPRPSKRNYAGTRRRVH